MLLSRCNRQNNRKTTVLPGTIAEVWATVTVSPASSSHLCTAQQCPTGAFQIFLTIQQTPQSVHVKWKFLFWRRMFLKKKTVVSFVVTFTPTGQACLKSHRYHPGCISLFLSQDKKLLWLNTDEEMKLSKCDRSWWMFRLGYLNQQCYDVHQIWVKVTSVPLGHVATCSLWFMEIVLTLLFH